MSPQADNRQARGGESAETRACPQCGREFNPKRPHHEYDSRECQYQGWIEKQVLAAQTGAQCVDGGTRRPSRDGKGTRLYVTYEEMSLLFSGFRQLDLPPTEATVAFKGKLVRAMNRAAERAMA